MKKTLGNINPSLKPKSTAGGSLHQLNRSLCTSGNRLDNSSGGAGQRDKAPFVSKLWLGGKGHDAKLHRAAPGGGEDSRPVKARLCPPSIGQIKEQNCSCVRLQASPLPALQLYKKMQPERFSLPVKMGSREGQVAL